MKLYELTEEFQQVQALLETCEGDEESQKAINDTLEGIAGEIQAKLQGCAAVYKNIAAEAEALAAEEKRIALKRRRLENNADRVKAYAFAAMEAAGITDSKGTLHSLHIRTNPPAVEVLVDPEDLPSPYRKITYTADKTNIKKVLSAVEGQATEWARLTRSKSLQIS